MRTPSTLLLLAATVAAGATDDSHCARAMSGKRAFEGDDGVLRYIGSRLRAAVLLHVTATGIDGPD